MFKVKTVSRFTLVVCTIILLFYFNQISLVKANDITGLWTATTSLPYILASHSSFTKSDKLFVINGSAVTGQTHDDVLEATILPNNELFNWHAISHINPPLIWHSVSSNNNYAYILGGFIDSINNIRQTVNTVSYSNISGGSPNNWQATVPLPEGLAQGESVISGSHIYFAGGWTTDFVQNVRNKVYYAPINSDGTLGSWLETTPLPQALSAFGMFETGNKIIVVGGRNSSQTPVNNVWLADILPNGTLGAWNPGPSLPVPISNAGYTKIGNFVVIAGGWTGYSTLKDVYYAPINPDGTLGTWLKSANQMPEERCCGSLTASSNHLYYTGGHNPSSGQYFSDVFMAEFTGGTPAPQKILVIPGMYASWNADALLNCKDSGYSGNWELASFAADYYNPLLQTLEKSDHEVIPYYYDWRRDVRSHVGSLKDLIQSSSTKFYLVGHSMGGLLGRAYLESTTNSSNLDKLLTVGSPHQGTVFAYPAWSAGEIWNDDIFQRIAMTIALKRCSLLTGNDRQSIRTFFPSVQNLLPTFNYLYDKKQELDKDYSLQDAKNNWLPNSLLNSPFYGVEVGTISGYGYETLYKLSVKDPNKKDLQNGDWTDGFPMKRYHTISGDKTVLSFSSTLPGANSRIINKKHVELVSTAEGISEILDFLNISVTPISAAITSPETALVILSPDADIYFEPEENPRNNEGITVIFSPKNRDYKITANSKKDEATIIVAQFLKNDITLWKEYKINKGLKKGILKFNQIDEDILEWN